VRVADENDVFTANATPTLQQLVDYFVDSFYDVQKVRRLENAAKNAVAEGQTVATAATIQAASALFDRKESLFEEAEDIAGKITGTILAYVVAHMLGIEVPPGAIRSTWAPGQPSPLGAAIGGTLLSIFSRPEGELTPGQEGAERLIGSVASLTIKGWAEGIIGEEMLSLAGIVHAVEAVSELGRNLIDGMGISRLMRVALRPLAQTLVATPLTWKTNKAYRPNLLGDADILKAFIRGDYSATEAREELARAGYSDRRQDILIKGATKNMSLADAMQLVRHNVLEREGAVERLKWEGYDDGEARLLVVASELKAMQAIDDNTIPWLTRAYVDREMSESEFATLFPPDVYTDQERAAYLAQARMQREWNVKHLSHAEVLECVELNVVTMAYYRAWLEREGYPDDERTALELRAQIKINKIADVEKARKDLADAKAAAKAAKDAADAARRAEIERQRALARRGPIGELTRAAVHGLIPIERVIEVLNAQYDADTVQIFVDDVEQQRVAYVAQQQAADDARKRAAIRHIDVGALERAVVDGVLTLDDYTARLRAMGFQADDVTVLHDSLAARLEQLADAKAKHDAAEAAAKIKTIDLGRFEALVRRGVRSMADYDALLQSLGFDDPSRAAMVDLLQTQIADDAAAAKARADAKAAALDQGVSLEQYRRAVILNLATVDQFTSWLVANHYTADAVRLLVAELERDVADADAARKKRDAAAAAADTRALQLSTVRRAAVQGIITPAVYQARLVAAGYTPDDVAIDLALLTQEIADYQDALKRRAAADAPAPPPELTPADVARAVQAGVLPMDAYRAALTARGYRAADVETQVAVLDARIAAGIPTPPEPPPPPEPAPPPTLTLAQIAAAVKAGVQPIDDYRAALVARGYGADDVDTLVALLADAIAGPPPPPDAVPPTPGAPPPPTLTLAQLAAAVKAGVQPLEAYRAALVTAGLAPDDVATLTRTLGDELAATNAAKARRDAIGSTVKPAGVSLGVLEQQVKSGAIGLDAYQTALEQAGVDPVDVALLADLLVSQLTST